MRKVFFKILLVNIGIVLAVLAMTEFALRLSGYEPGLLCGTDAKYPVIDSLIVTRDFYADEHGITKFSEEARQFVIHAISGKNEIHNSGDFPVAALIVKSFQDVMAGRISNDFTRYLQSLKSQPPDSLSTLEKFQVAYQASPVNTAGFRSIEFRNYDTDRIKVLLLGDSNAFGEESSNLTFSYADVLSANGYAVLNSGITGADPAQYWAITKKYLPVLEPDVVVLSFCMTNDFKEYRRPIIPGQLMF